MTVLEEKKTLRRQMRSALQGVLPEERRIQSSKACERLSALPAFVAAKTLLAYMPMQTECDPGELVQRARQLGKRVAFPKCKNGELELYLAENFTVGMYGILEPEPLPELRVSPEELDFVIVPGVAFDAERNRMGHGAGYYDRLLCKTAAFRAGIALNIQIVDRVPTETNDIRMDAVASAFCIYCK